MIRIPPTKSKKRKGDGVRAHHSKTKTGCLTCKARRVKCDELKPICKRCLRFGVTCDGYDTVARETSPRTKPLRPLVPNSRNEAKVALVAARQPPTTVYRQPGVSRFENEHEARYFYCFSTEIANHLGGCFDPNMWPGSFLRASETVWPIRKGLIALGALDLTSSSGVSQIREGPKKENITRNYLFALHEYSRFIKGMKQVVTPDDLRTQLLASILIICFESYLGNSKAVELQVCTSTRLLESWKKKYARPWMHPLSSPAPNIVENELIHLFERLELEVIQQADPMPQEEHMLRKDNDVEAIANMPKEFVSLGEGRMWGNLLHRRTVHLLNAHDDKNSSDASVWDRVGEIATPEIIAELQRHKSDFQLWGQAFDPLFKQSLTSKGVKNFPSMAIMRAHYLVLMIMFESLFRRDELFYDYLHNDFVEMLALCRTLLQSEDSNFTLSAHSIVVLDLVAKKCRDPQMRREAIQLLVERPRREAFWDSVMAGNICKWIVKVEEEGMVNGYIPEESRIRKIGAKFDLVKKEAELWGYQPIEKDNLVDLRRRETKISWATPSGSMPCYSGQHSALASGTRSPTLQDTRTWHLDNPLND